MSEDERGVFWRVEAPLCAGVSDWARRFKGLGWHARFVPAVMVVALAGCGGSATAPPAATPTSQQQGGDKATIRADALVVSRKGYDPASRVAQTADGFGGTLYAFHGTCHGSADGYCQIMLFFDGTRFSGTDTTNPSTAITGYEAAGAARIAVTYAHYAKADPLCCPSLAPESVTYRWNGRRMTPLGLYGVRAR